MFLLKDICSDAGEARTRGPSVPSQKHSTTEPLRSLCIVERKAKHDSIHMIMGNYCMHLYESLKSMYNSTLIVIKYTSNKDFVDCSLNRACV